MIRIVLTSLLLLSCTSQNEMRTLLNAQTTTAVVHDELTINVSGASIIKVTPGDLGGFVQIPKIEVRAQSLDVRLDVHVSTCQPEVLHVELTHLRNTQLISSVRTFLDGSDATTEATRAAIGGGIELNSDLHDPSWTPLAAEHPFPIEAATAQPARLKWTLCADRARKTIKLLEGHVDRAQCVFPESRGACAESNIETSEDLGAAPLVVRHRLKNAVPSTFRFAVWGNNASNTEVQARIIDAVNASDAEFAVISGDLTEFGSTADLKSAQEQLDLGLLVPWFATLGDRDIVGQAGNDYVGMIGSSNFCFDAGPVRIAVIDSADRAIGADVRSQLRSWLGGASLGWNDEPPAASLVVTHVPPFDVYGTRTLALKDRSEAASISATLRRSGVAYTLTSQLGRYLLQSEGGVKVVHSGGGGAPMESTSSTSFHWLLVTVESVCDREDTGATACQTDENSTECVCVRLERQDL